MPKVMFLTDSLSNGGAERQLALLAKYLPPQWERRVWSLGDGPFAQIIRDNGIPLRIKSRNWRFDISPAFDLWRILLDWKPDVVHSWGGWIATLSAMPVVRSLELPIVNGAIRNAFVSGRRGTLIGLSIKLADRIIANSQAGLTAWGINAKRGRLVYNGFEPDRLLLSVRSGKSPDEPTTVIMTGRMTKEKDFRSFLAASRALLSEDATAWRFIAMGDGPDRLLPNGEVQDLIDARLVAFPSPSLDVPIWVTQADVGGSVVPSLLSHRGGRSNSIMEYMAAVYL